MQVSATAISFINWPSGAAPKNGRVSWQIGRATAQASAAPVPFRLSRLPSEHP
jgi:hypothetical protein